MLAIMSQYTPIFNPAIEHIDRQWVEQFARDFRHEVTDRMVFLMRTDESLLNDEVAFERTLNHVSLSVSFEISHGAGFYLPLTNIGELLLAAFSCNDDALMGALVILEDYAEQQAGFYTYKDYVESLARNPRVKTSYGDSDPLPCVGEVDPNAVIITRHQALVEFLRTQYPELAQAKVITHASVHDVVCKNVWGVLPLHLARFAETVTTVDLNLPPELRGVELTLEDIKKYFGGVSTYKVDCLDLR